MQDELAAEGLLLGVARAEPYAETERLIAERRARGLFGDLRFTLTNTPRSCHPERLVRGARSVIAAAMPLWRPAAPRPEGRPVACRAMPGATPTRPLRERLTALADRLRARGARCAVFVDSNHHVDRDAAVRAGLAFSARNTMAIVPGEGSFVALGAIVTDAELEPADELVPPGCGSCTLCLDACPTGALIEPGVLDATQCLSTTTQARGAVPEAHAAALEDRVYGCDICQDVCPWNTGPAGRRAELPGRRGRLGLAGRLAASCPARSCWRATRTSTCPSATRATCAATRSSRSATRPRSTASWRGPMRTTPIRCCATPRGRALTG